MKLKSMIVLSQILRLNNNQIIENNQVYMQNHMSNTWKQE